MIMKFPTVFAMALLFGFILEGKIPTCLAQEIRKDNFYIGYSHQRADVPYFSVSMYCFAGRESPDRTTILLKTQIGFPDLQFVKIRDDLFRCRYDVDLEFFDPEGNRVAKETWTSDVEVRSFFETTNVARNHISERLLHLTPGRYSFTAGLLDHETQKRGEIEGYLDVRDFSGLNMLVSDIVFQDSLKAPRSEESSARIRDHSGSLYAVLEVYNVVEGDTINVACEVLDRNEVAFLDGTVQVISRGARTRIGVEMGKSLLASRTPALRLTIQAGTDTSNITLADPYADTRTGLFENVEEALAQLVYVATREEMKLLKSMEPHERESAFHEFWMERDPTPETRDNEHMLNFYVRVDFANRTFAGSRPGWQTEMGEVYIKLGRPDAMMKGTSNERFAQIMSMNEPTVVWRYEDYRVYIVFNYLGGEYRIANYGDVQHVLNDGVIF